jgi:orotidine-5'-phosphate decarboxylase
MTDGRSRLIVALDVPDRVAALSVVERLAGRVGYFKIGPELFINEGPELVREIRERGASVFLDLKFHDIPNTVAAAVRAAARLDVQMLTVHAAGGPAMLEAARAAAESWVTPPLLLGVTALTSLSEADSRRIGVYEAIETWVERLADLAYQARLTGLVASPWELPHLRQKFRGQMKLVVPGIRPSGASSDDQRRIAGPADAVRAGADFLVVGRPILQAPDPQQAADQIAREMETGDEQPTKKH